MKDKKRKWLVLAILLLSLIFPAFVWGVSALLDVDTVDVTASLTQESVNGPDTVYRLSLPPQEAGQRYELMFESTGNVIRVLAGDRLLYEYGAELAACGRMIGRVYAHVFLPESAYEQPLTLRLTASDGNASPRLQKLELCPHAESTRFYIANRNLGLPLALVLLAVAFCIPVFLTLANDWRLMQEGVLFGCILVCFSLLLLSRGGHFLLFSSNQIVWNDIRYLASWLLPVLFLFYFRTLEKARLQRALLLGAALVGALFFLFGAALGLTNTLPFYRLAVVYQLTLLLDLLVIAYTLIQNFRSRRLSLPRRLLQLLALAWLLAVLPFGLLPSLSPDLPRFDPLSLFAVALFYVLCYLFAESALRTHRDARETALRIETLEQAGLGALSSEALAKALASSYECIYIIDPATGSHSCYYKNGLHEILSPRATGETFFDALEQRIRRDVLPEDRDYLLHMLSRDAVLTGLEHGRTYSLIYRVLPRSGEPVYHKLQIIQRRLDGRDTIFFAVRDIDEAMRLEREHSEELETIRKKEHIHMEAILASAAGYLEANLTRDLLLDRSQTRAVDAGFAFDTLENAPSSFNAFMRWWAEQSVVTDRIRFLQVNDRDYLINCFRRQEYRASVAFSSRTSRGEILPCRQVAYLYQDRASGDIMSFHVIYDLTEQQRKEKELQELEEQLRLSRVRTFTSQMQPHFLYNALGSIQEIVLDDPVYASELIGDFTTHLRGSIRAMASDEAIPFRQELENIRAYVNIEKMRFGEKLKVVYEIGAEDFPIVPLSIQPLVENAIQHGVYQRGPRGGTVTIRSRETDAAWVVQVEDDGVGFDVEALQKEVEAGTRDSTGLKNLVFRLSKIMQAAVDISSRPGAGTCVTVTVPKEGKQT